MASFDLRVIVEGHFCESDVCRSFIPFGQVVVLKFDCSLRTNTDFWISVLEFLLKWDEDGESLIFESSPGDFHAQPCLEKSVLEEQKSKC